MRTARTRLLVLPARGFTNDSGIASSASMVASKGALIRASNSPRLRLSGLFSKAGKAIVLGAIVGWLGLRAAEERAAGDAGGHSGSRLFVRSLLSASVVSVGVTVCLYAIIGAPPPP